MAAVYRVKLAGVRFVSASRTLAKDVPHLDAEVHELTFIFPAADRAKAVEKAEDWAVAEDMIFESCEATLHI